MNVTAGPVIIGLRAKGRARKSDSAFIVDRPGGSRLNRVYRHRVCCFWYCLLAFITPYDVLQPGKLCLISNPPGVVPGGF